MYELEDATWSQQISIAADLNQPLLLQCSNDHPDYIEWRFNGVSLFPSNVSMIGSLIAGRDLLIQKMTDIVVGNYSCIATWFVNRTVVVVTYIVTITKDLYNGTSLITIDHPEHAIWGNKYELNCHTSPDADASVVWLKNGNIISYNHSLAFDAIFTNDSGLYTCTFDPDHSMSQSVGVEVFVPPMFLTEKVRTILLMQGATVPKTLIDCRVTGIPVPSVRLYKNGILQSVTSINATDADYAIYQCFANNSAGLSNQIIRALRQDTFNAPSNLQCSTTMTSGTMYNISISWMIPTYFWPPKTINYIIYYCSGQNVMDYRSTTTDTHYHLQLDAVVDKTVYVSSVYGGGVSQSAPSFCQVPQPNQLQSIELNVDCQRGVARWLAEDGTFLSTSPSPYVWKYCFNENQTLHANQSTSGKFIVELPSRNSICAFRVHYKYGLESLSSTLLYCYYQKKADIFVSKSLNCSSPPTSNILQVAEILEFALSASFFIIMTVVVLLVAVSIILKRKLTSARVNAILKLAAPSNWDIALPDIDLKPTDCSSVVTTIDDLCYATSEAINSCDGKETWQHEAFGSCTNDGLLVGQVAKKGSTRRQVSVLSSWMEAWNILHSDCAQTALELVKYQHIICQLFAPDGSSLEPVPSRLTSRHYSTIWCTWSEPPTMQAMRFASVSTLAGATRGQSAILPTGAGSQAVVESTPPRPCAAPVARDLQRVHTTL
eukprot:Em0030g38a